MMFPIMANRAMFLALASGLLLSLPGCLATRGWVTEQINPLGTRVSSLENRVSGVEGRMDQTEARVDEVLARFDNLHLERRFVLDLKDATNFAFDSSALTSTSERALQGFLSDLDTADDKAFLVIGHTDSKGSDAHNYQLGQRRAASVAQYLIAQGIHPLHVSAISYGETAPVANNNTREGRWRNRRVEVLVYKEAVTSALKKGALHAAR
jgi:outer membrane protein OmpA-like peptidoglycan-associated protein